MMEKVGNMTRHELEQELLRCRQALEGVIEWLNGPEGPDVLFGAGVKMKDKVEAASR